MIILSGEDSKKNPDFPGSSLKRRDFLDKLWRLTLPLAILNAPLTGFGRKELPNPKNPTVGELMDLFIRQAVPSALENTVDTLKSGSRDTQISGVVTSMFPTLELIRKSVELKMQFYYCT